MAHRSSNVRRSRWTVGLLDVQPTDQVLEIGFGPGVAIAAVAARATDDRTVGLWRDPPARLADLARRMRPGGRVALVSQPRCPGATAETTVAAGRELAAYLRGARFSDLRSETLNLRPPAVHVVATR
jgi:hypothetical protein